jgi:hypothetical protein
MILWSGGDAGWELVPDSARLAIGAPAQMTRQRRPRRFRMPEAEGVSDHLPLVVDIAPR